MLVENLHVLWTLTTSADGFYHVSSVHLEAFRCYNVLIFTVYFQVCMHYKLVSVSSEVTRKNNEMTHGPLLTKVLI